MLRRLRAGPPILFSGGGALNARLVKFVEDGLGAPLVVPSDPQMVGAYGAALIALETVRAPE